MKNEEFVKQDIINDIQTELRRNECENIGKVWERKCPKCNRLLIYTNYRSYTQILKKNSLCSVCCQLGNGHPHTSSHKKYMSKLLTNRVVTWGDKIKKNHWSKNRAVRKRIVEAQSKLMCNLIKRGKLNKQNKSFKTGYCVNRITNKKEFYRSSYELRRMNELNFDVTVKFWTTKHNIRIPYSINGIVHFYLPDFWIEFVGGEKVIEETKGYIENQETFKLKSKAARKYCKQNGYKYIINYGNTNK